MSATVKHDDKVSSVDHFQQVFSLARQLSDIGVAIYEHHWDSLTFGSWTIVAGSRHRRFEFSWDGREFSVSVSQCEFSDSRSHQCWSAPKSHTLPSDDPCAPFKYLEQFFKQEQQGLTNR
jgi:hypothetical protein